MPRYTIDLSGDVLNDLDAFAKRHHISRAEAAKRAFAILAIADEEKKKGNDLGIVKIDSETDATELVARITGI
ncbi:MAG: hypothetical protein MJE63_17045 [Proteobacteria bacterium]|nr:hypothetical protein [Pseudomonadota bacterium]